MYNIGVPEHSQLRLLEAGLWFLGGWKFNMHCTAIYMYKNSLLTHSCRGIGSVAVRRGGISREHAE